ncbi:AAA family ATPase [Bradyrhizobium sp. RDI18]|uniref:AAA family ATPase n=1 Tax=Bradyrhizobium sp. RDI18 TaxID=3367400 RepID=UPI00371A11AA
MVEPETNSIEAQLREAIKRIHIDLPDQCAAVKRAHALVYRSPLKPAELLVMESDPMLGKTRVLDLISGDIRSAYAPRIEGWTCRAECESVTDGSTLGLLLCRALDAPAIGLGNMPRLGQYICTRIDKHKRKPVLLALDNAHLLNEEALEILAAIIASGVVPLILSGRNGTSTVARRLIDMVGQVMEIVKLSPLPYARGADLGQIRDFLLIIQGDLSPILNQLGISMTLATDDWAKRVWGGTWGSHGKIIALVRETLITIVRSHTQQRRNSRYTIKCEDFAEAWRLQFAQESPLKFNPFKRADAPTLGEIEDARKELEENRKRKKLRLPKSPKGKGALIWR